MRMIAISLYELLGLLLISATSVNDWKACCSHTRNIFKSISEFPLFILPQSVLATSAADVSIPDMVSCEQLPSENLSIAMGQKIAFPNRVLADTRSFVQIVVGFPDAVVRVHENTSKHICCC